MTDDFYQQYRDATEDALSNLEAIAETLKVVAEDLKDMNSAFARIIEDEEEDV